VLCFDVWLAIVHDAIFALLILIAISIVIANNHSKPRGIRAARKLRLHRLKNKWADKDYNKRMIGKTFRSPFAGASHAKGIVVEKV
jgi:hypothetical protein